MVRAGGGVVSDDGEGGTQAEVAAGAEAGSFCDSGFEMGAESAVGFAHAGGGDVEESEAGAEVELWSGAGGDVSGEVGGAGGGAGGGGAGVV